MKMKNETYSFMHAAQRFGKSNANSTAAPFKTNSKVTFFPTRDASGAASACHSRPRPASTSEAAPSLHATGASVRFPTSGRQFVALSLPAEPPEVATPTETLPFLASADTSSVPALPTVTGTLRILAVLALPVGVYPNLGSGILGGGL